MNADPIYTHNLLRLLAEHEVRLEPVDSPTVRMVQEKLQERRKERVCESAK